MPVRPEDWPHVREVFERALDIPVSERPAFVATACGGNEAIRDEILRMLDSHGRAGHFLSVPANEPPGETSPPPSFEGQQVGPYLLQARIGAGGMGEVYKARDTRLNRTVAIKVLPPDTGDDEVARERFEREARAIAALNHPHICGLHDIGELPNPDPSVAAPMRFLVMEHLEGETLADRLARRPLSVSDAIEVAVQIASALNAAHRAGIVHRDLKPGNVFLLRQSSPAGLSAKLLDFGLAKATAAPVGGAAAQLAADQALTTPGMILGTVQYMAPEQLEGRTADARTDIFAFGALVYEMITGRKAFAGTSEASVIAAILHDEPPRLSNVAPLTPAPLDRVVVTCLAKDPDDRWQTARDLLRELTWVRNGSVETVALPAARRRNLSWLGWVAALIVAAAVIVGSFFVGRPSSALPLLTFNVYPPPGTTFLRGAAQMAVSPDGNSLVFVALSPGPSLWVLRFDSTSPRLLERTAGASEPFWSADGRSIGFFARGKLFRISEDGGEAQVICNAPDARGGTWNRDGVILFGGWNGGIQRIVEKDGTATPATVLDGSRKERSHSWPVFLEDGRRFLYVARSDDPEKTGIYQGSLDSSETRRVLADRSNVSAAGAYLISLNGRSLVAHAYDADRASVVGETITIADSIVFDNPERSGSPFASNASGVLAYRSASPDSRLVWFNRSGKELDRWVEGADYHHPSLAPDDQRVAVEKTDPATRHHTVWVVDMAGRESRLVLDPAGAHMPVMSNDGRVAYSSNRNGANRNDIYVIRADGVGGPEPLLVSSTKANQLPTDWSRDSQYLLYDRGSDVWVVPVTHPGDAHEFVAADGKQTQGRFSPDRRWVAYTSNESGANEVYVQPFPAADARWRVSTDGGGGAQPQWRHDGTELFYLAPDGNLKVVAVKSSGTKFETGAPQVLFNTGITSGFTNRRNHYVVARDGNRFLVNISAADGNTAPITVMLNWDARLKK
jgi:serine/threonine protein kinase/Tol biopolymer transport system component